MQLAPPYGGEHVRRLIPGLNPNREDRALAWNQWWSAGGAEPVLKFIRWSNGTSTEDEEILQETLVTAYLKVERGAYEHRDVPFTAFLKKIAWFKILEASRRYVHQVPLDEVEEVVEDDDHPSEYAEQWKEHEALKIALDALPKRRSNILLLYETGYTTAEIADHLSIREELVRKEKSLGLKQLRQQVALAG